MQNDKANFKVEFNKRLIAFSLSIIKLCQNIRKDRNLAPIADQLIRSATSVGANIVEAKSCGSKKDYIRFFEISLKSANETKYWLILIKESDPNFRTVATKLFDECTEIAKIIASGIITMKSKI